MCIICISGKGVAQPSEELIRTMFENNPHGAGYMVARKTHVEIHKGFMSVADLLHALRQERFTANDVVVYHFRISTQAGVTPRMTQPFAVTREAVQTKALDLRAPLGMVHNGIIRLTSDSSETTYSDTALFDVKYLSYMVRSKRDLTDPVLQASIKALIQSKMVLLDGSGEMAVIGDFVTDYDGLLFSNTSYMPHDWKYWYGLDDDEQVTKKYWVYTPKQAAGKGGKAGKGGAVRRPYEH